MGAIAPMLLQLYFYLPPAKAGVGEIMKHHLYVCVHACVRLSHFYINLHVSFIYQDIFTKFAENVYVCENMSIKKFCHHFKNNIATMANCSKVIDMF